MILWHNDVHDKGLSENLVYFQLSFAPVYRRELIAKAINELLKKHKIVSFCIYEIYGLYDVMIRMWLPNRIGGASFTSMLRDAVENLGCTRVVPFFATEVALHWGWWSEDKDRMIRPSAEDVKTLTVTQMRHGLKSKECLADLEDKHLAKTIETNNPGIKFFVIIPPPMLAATPGIEMENMVKERLLRLLIQSKTLVEPSMYLGSGFAWILIKGKVAPERYSFIDEFVKRVNEFGVTGFYIRTYTYLVTGSLDTFTREREEVPAADSASHDAGSQAVDLAQLLNRIEGDNLEMKGSLFLNVDRYLHEKNYAIDFDDKIVKEGVLKSIVAFLNTRGGLIIIGALERSRYENILSKEGSPFNGKPIVGDWIITGVSAELKRVKDMDGYIRFLADKIKDHIGGDASALVVIEEVSFDGQRVVIVRVPKVPNWFYLDKESFYVRRSGSTIALNGPEREHYQKVAKG